MALEAETGTEFRARSRPAVLSNKTLSNEREVRGKEVWITAKGKFREEIIINAYIEERKSQLNYPR